MEEVKSTQSIIKKWPTCSLLVAPIDQSIFDVLKQTRRQKSMSSQEPGTPSCGSGQTSTSQGNSSQHPSLSNPGLFTLVVRDTPGCCHRCDFYLHVTKDKQCKHDRAGPMSGSGGICPPVRVPSRPHGLRSGFRNGIICVLIYRMADGPTVTHIIDQMVPDP